MRVTGGQRATAMVVNRRPLSAGAKPMSADNERAFHLERAAQCKKMAEDALDPAVKRLHQQLAEFHEAEAKRHLTELAANEDEI
jgi:hypothetical protein